MPGNLIGPKQVAERLDCKIRYAYTVMRSMRYVDIGNGQKNQKLRVYEEDLDEYIASRTKYPGSSPGSPFKSNLPSHKKPGGGCPKIPRRTD